MMQRCRQWRRTPSPWRKPDVHRTPAALAPPVLLPGSLINTSPTDYKVIETIRLQRFNGKSWDFVD